MKTYTVENVRIEYKGEEIYDGRCYDMPMLEIVAENLTDEFYQNDKREEIPEEEWEAKTAEILAELEENAEYYEEEEVDGDYYIEQEYYASVL